MGSGATEAKLAVRNLLETDNDLAVWFTILCESGTAAIDAQAWQVAEELKADETEVRDAMLELAHELLPDSPAGAEDPRQTLFREMRVWASQQSQSVQGKLAADLGSGDGEAFAQMWDSSLSCFRAYLRARCKDALGSSASKARAKASLKPEEAA